MLIISIVIGTVYAGSAVAQARCVPPCNGSVTAPDTPRARLSSPDLDEDEMMRRMCETAPTQHMWPMCVQLGYRSTEEMQRMQEQRQSRLEELLERDDPKCVKGNFVIQDEIVVFHRRIRADDWKQCASTGYRAGCTACVGQDGDVGWSIEYPDGY